jgi:ParB family transcriptional regulator, chromosome partitioning protein
MLVLMEYLLKSTALDRMQGLETLGIIDVEERAVISFLLKEGLKPSSVRSNLFSMLSLPADLTAAIHQYGINSNIALALTGISAKNLNTDDAIAQGERMKAMQTVIDENLSLLGYFFAAPLDRICQIAQQMMLYTQI